MAQAQWAVAERVVAAKAAEAVAAEAAGPVGLAVALLEGMMVDISSTVVVIMVLICSSKTAILG